jgi:hypothetical protein
VDNLIWLIVPILAFDSCRYVAAQKRRHLRPGIRQGSQRSSFRLSGASGERGGNGRCNSGSLGTRVHAPVTIAGQEWTPYQYGSTEFIWSLDGPGGAGTCAQQASGTVDLLALLKWMQANGHAAADATLKLVDGVFEICSTGGVPETFRVTSYSVTATAA